MKILMAQKWSWKSLTYSTFKLKNLSTGSVDMVSYNSLKNFLQLNEKFQNFRRKSHLCKVYFGVLQYYEGKKSGFYYFAIFSSEQKWRTLLGFPSKFQIGKDLLPTLWTFIKRQGRWNSAHWLDVLPFPHFFKHRKKKNRNYYVPSNVLTFRRPRPKFSILPLPMYSPGPAKYMGIRPHLLLDRYVNPISTKGGKLYP